MITASVYISAILFALAVFPVHVFNYAYLNTEEKYAMANVGVYGKSFFNVNTVKNKPNEMQINGKNKKVDVKQIKASFYKIFDKLCIYKIIQLGDYGLKKEANAYVSLAQSAFSTAIYKFIQVNGNYCKLRNYTILNEEHSEIRYYAKVITVINAIVVAKIIMILIKEKRK